MKTRSLRALLGVLVALVSAASLGSCEQTFADGRYEQPVFTEIEQVATAVEYATAVDHAGNPISLKLDIWQPKDDTAERRPAVVWEFGGAFVAGTRASMAGYAQDSARRGYVGVTIDYRLDARPDTGGGLGGINYGRAVPNAYDDSIAAVQWLQANAGKYKVDTGAIVVGGYSAGAINAINTAQAPGTRGPAVTPVAGVVSIAGMTFTALTGQDFLGLGSPRADLPPWIMFGGTADTTVAYSAQQKTCEDQKTAGNICQFVSYDGAGHEIGFTQSADIQAKAHAFIAKEILPLHYYRKAA
jgi:acetyl esterase